MPDPKKPVPADEDDEVGEASEESFPASYAPPSPAPTRSIRPARH
jgi:hypothetical protein